MSSINWPEVLAIFVGFAAFFIYLMTRLDHTKNELKAEIRDLDKKIEGLRKDINRIDSKVSNIEGQITQMTRPNVTPIKRLPDGPIDDHPKEN